MNNSTESKSEGEKRRGESAFAWQALSTIIFLGTNVAYIAIMARLIEREVHGVFSILNVMIMFTTFFSQSGVGAALVQRKEFNKSHLSCAIYVSFTMSFLLASALFLSASKIAAFYDNKFTGILVQVIAVNILFGTIRIIPRSLLMRKLAFRQLFTINVGGLLIGRLIGVVLGFLGYGIWAFVFGAVITNIMTGVIATLLQPYSLRISIKIPELKDICGFGVGYTLVRLLSYATGQIDKLILGKLLTSSETLADFEKSQFVTNLPRKIIGDSLDPVLFSMLSKRQNDEEFLQTKYFGFLSLALCAGIYATSFIASLNEAIPLVFLGSEWRDCSPLVAIFAYAIPLFIIARFSDILVRCKNKMFFSIPIKIAFIGMLIAAIFIGLESGLATVARYYMVGLTIYSTLMFLLSLMLINGNALQLLRRLSEAKYFFVYCVVKALFINSLIRQQVSSSWGAVVFAFSLDAIVFVAMGLTLRTQFLGKGNVQVIGEFLGPLGRKLGLR